MKKHHNFDGAAATVFSFSDLKNKIKFETFIRLKIEIFPIFVPF